jgi:hypothetical protein
MKLLALVALPIIFAALVGGCGESIGYDEGYDDGYASGYNTTCQIRDTIIRGEWDNKKYSEGYQAGNRDGSAQCLADGGPKGWNK